RARDGEGGREQPRHAEAKGGNIPSIQIGRDGQPRHSAPTGPDGNRSEAEYCAFQIAWAIRLHPLTPASSIPKVSKKPRFPSAVMIIARLCCILSVQPRSK